MLVRLYPSVSPRRKLGKAGDVVEVDEALGLALLCAGQVAQVAPGETATKTVRTTRRTPRHVDEG